MGYSSSSSLKKSIGPGFKEARTHRQKAAERSGQIICCLELKEEIKNLVERYSKSFEASCHVRDIVKLNNQIYVERFLFLSNNDGKRDDSVSVHLQTLIESENT